MSSTPTRGLRILATFVALGLAGAADAQADDKAPDPSGPVSFDKQIRPILRANCQGCHQPAKAQGDYVMTAFDRLLAGGESMQAAVVPGKPDESYLIEQITPDGAQALMPKDKPPLSKAEIDLVTRWIAEGAKDDSPAGSLQKYDREHPPSYSRPPVITAIDFSPDGTLLAVGGFHEVLLWKADGSERVARLIGLSERIESVRFSPDGTRLAVVGGLPARMGEVQVWDVATAKLLLSAPFTADTLYGASWSPDGTKIAFGCTDNTVRAIDAKTGEQVLFMGSHNDWALDTVFSKEGDHLISVGRDQTAKLTEFATQRFVDNITSITPGALKGGIAAVARHPSRDEIVMGGADGEPKVYRVFRQTQRVIGDDSNMIRRLTAMPGRIFGVAIRPDGKRIAAASSLDGAGRVDVFSYEFDTELPDDVKAIMRKVASTRSADEKARLEAYLTDGATRVASTPIPAGVYALAFTADGKALAAAGADGLVRFLDPETGEIVRSFGPAPLGGPSEPRPAPKAVTVATPESSAAAEALPPGTTITALEVRPASIFLRSKFDYNQLVVLGTTADGAKLDLTRLVTATPPTGLIDLSRTGLARPLADGQGLLTLACGDKTAEIPVKVAGLATDRRVDYVHDVMPIMSRLGCNAGTCHGSAQGKNGFKLSLRGYDPIFDVRALTDDHGARRINLASADDSMMLLKPSGGVPHVGGAVMRPGEAYYEALRAWIADGAKLDLKSSRVTKIEVFPSDPTVERIGATQQLRVTATYADGEVRDVTREAFLETGNAEVAVADRTGVMTAVRRGEAPILVRFEGAYAASTLTVMGDRTGFAWEEPPAYNRIDELAAAKWRRLKIRPSGLCTDSEFLRRVHLDLTGLPPTAEQVRAFLADPAESRVKRAAVVDRLIGNADFVEFWTNKWADLLQVNRKFLGVEGSAAFRKWIREQVDKNTPYDDFVRQVVTASGSNHQNPAASYYKILREPTATMENTTQLFLAIRFNCNKCHDHPFERWTQDQYYETSAYFAQFGLKADPESKGKQIAGTAVEGATPLYEEVFDKSEGEVLHDRTKEVTPPKFPFDCKFESVETAPRRQALAAWMTSRDNPYFAKSYVNRLWGYLFGVGIIEPIDDIRAGNPATNPELLDYLTREFLESGFDARHILKLITKSRTYQLSVASNEWNADDKINYSHATARRLPAEVMLDAVYRVTGSTSKFPGVPAGTRAAALPDSGVELPSGFLNTFGRPPRESACECERTAGMQLGPVMALVSGPALGEAIADPNNALAKVVNRVSDDRAMIDELFVRVLNRPATDAEIDACLKDLATVEEDHVRMARDLGTRELEFALKRPQLERDREAAVAEAEAALAAYEAEAAPKVAAKEKEKAELAAKLEAELKEYEAGLVVKLADWEKAQSARNIWLPLVPKSVTDTNGATFTIGPDGVIVTAGNDEAGDINFTAETDQTGITGIRLEALADDKLPNKGPGRAPDGNFVLNEMKITTAPKADPKKAEGLLLVKPLADFSQQNFAIAQLIDGSPNGGKGWAVSPSFGVTHWATFETKTPVGHEGGTVLAVKLQHRFGNKGYMPGRFRISVTRVPGPIGLSLAEDLRAIVATAPEVRTKAQQDALMAHFRSVDGEYRKKAAALAQAKAPLPIDPGLKDLKDGLEYAKRPVPVDPALARLRKDLDQSVQQTADRRLTAAQDVAWALINSPAFLFNH